MYTPGHRNRGIRSLFVRAQERRAALPMSGHRTRIPLKQDPRMRQTYLQCRKNGAIQVPYRRAVLDWIGGRRGGVMPQ